MRMIAGSAVMAVIMQRFVGRGSMARIFLRRGIVMLVAMAFKVEKADYFEIEDASVRASVGVTFS